MAALLVDLPKHNHQDHQHMADATTGMDRIPIRLHLEPEPRLFPGAPPVAHLGLVPCKRERVDWSFSTWNFSLILAGQGSYRSEAGLEPVRAPCVLTQWPGAAMDYGPDRAGWTELYLIYPAGTGDQLRRSRLWPERRAWWPVADPARFLAAAAVLIELARSADPLAEADRIDRAAELAVVEARLGAAAAPLAGAEAAVAAIRARIESDWRRDHDLDRLARDQGLSPTHFRRLWERLVGVPPQRHLVQLRLRHACRALVRDERPVAAVAAEAGFADPGAGARAGGASRGRGGGPPRRGRGGGGGAAATPAP
jgi:AraC-like DNA-binding protein